jgi:hypothetical protein
VSTVLRGDEEQVRPLELFFDLVFVLAITQCTALMSHEPTWEGLAKACSSSGCRNGGRDRPHERARFAELRGRLRHPASAAG